MIFFNQLLRLSGILAPIILLFAIVISGYFHPGYSHISQAISELGAREVPYNNILNYTGLIPAGLLTLTFSIAMFRQFKRKPALFISCCLVALTGICRFFAGIFNCDPGCFPIITISGQLHAIFGILALFAGSIAPLAMTLGLRWEESKSLFYLSLILGTLALITFLLLVSQLWMQYFGGIQRILLIITYTWIIVVAVRMKTYNNEVSLNS